MIPNRQVDWANDEVRHEMEPLLLQDIRFRIEKMLAMPVFGHPVAGMVRYHQHDYGLDVQVAGRWVNVTFTLDPEVDDGR